LRGKLGGRRPLIGLFSGQQAEGFDRTYDLRLNNIFTCGELIELLRPVETRKLHHIAVEEGERYHPSG